MKTIKRWLIILPLLSGFDLLGIEQADSDAAQKLVPDSVLATPTPTNGPPTASPESLPAQPKRWPVQILSAIYGISGRDADVTARVKEHVEVFRRKFAVNPVDLGVDPSPRWNKSLRITYMKDGAQREQRRGENEDVLPESFYGPQDAAELRGWLLGTRWFGERPDVQFHPDQTFTSPGIPGIHRWEAVAANKLRLTWAGDRVIDYRFDHTWSSFSEVENGKNVFHLSK